MSSAYVGRFNIGFDKKKKPDAAGASSNPVTQSSDSNSDVKTGTELETKRETETPVSEPAAPVSPEPLAADLNSDSDLTKPTREAEIGHEFELSDVPPVDLDDGVPESDLDDLDSGSDLSSNTELELETTPDVNIHEAQKVQEALEEDKPEKKAKQSDQPKRADGSSMFDADDPILSEESDKTSYCYLARNMTNMAMRVVPLAKNRNDAVNTILYVLFHREPVVSEHIEKLADCCKFDNDVANLQAQIDMLSKSLSHTTSELKATRNTLKSMNDFITQMMTMLVWLVGERANASIDLSQSAASIDFMFPEQEFIRRRAESQTGEYMAYLADMQARARYKAAAAARDGKK